MDQPIFTKPITSELGNVSPVIIMPYLYTAGDLWYAARSVASQVTNNASFNCNAAKMSNSVARAVPVAARRVQQIIESLTSEEVCHATT